MRDNANVSEAQIFKKNVVLNLLCIRKTNNSLKIYVFLINLKTRVWKIKKSKKINRFKKKKIRTLDIIW